ncbi:hypothetical protein [Brevundimonas sp.]|jgi:hypothetical protein|nr:hypothetical protein [Brevundimonas sp.]
MTYGVWLEGEAEADLIRLADFISEYGDTSRDAAWLRFGKA